MTANKVSVRGGRVWLGPNVGDGQYEVAAQGAGAWLLEPVPADPFPYRLVDGNGYGWLIQPKLSDGVGPDPMYMVFPRLEDQEPGSPDIQPHSRIVAERGPVRPVAPAPADDCERLEGLLAYARTQAVGTLLFALHMLREECVRVDGHPQRMTAGRPGSWESSDLLDLSQACIPAAEVVQRSALPFGAVNPQGEHDADGVVGSVVEEVYKVLHRWVFGPDFHVELAETLAHLVGRVIDGRGGWDEATTLFIQDSEVGDKAEKLLLYTSRYYSYVGHG